MAALWARPLCAPCQPPACLSSSKDHRDPGGWAGLASRHWAVGRWAKQDRFLSSASALDLGLDLGLLFLLARCEPCPCLFPARCHERPELGFLDGSSLCGELTRDAGRMSIAQFKVSQLGCRCKCCTVGHCRNHSVYACHLPSPSMCVDFLTLCACVCVPSELKQLRHSNIG